MPARLVGLTLLAALLGASAPASPTDAAGNRPDPGPPPPDEGRLVYGRVPEVHVRGDDGSLLRLSALSSPRPLLLGLVFTRCAGICSPFLSSLRSAVAAVGGAGREFDVLVLSFDPRDTPDDMGALARRLGLHDAPGWTFGTAPVEELAALERAIGFWSRWDDSRAQFDHPALVVALRDGRVQRLLVGGDVRPVRLQEVVRDATGRFVRAYPLPGRVLFRCFDYDPETGRVTLDWGLLVLGLPALAAAIGTWAIFARGKAGRADGLSPGTAPPCGPRAG